MTDNKKKFVRVTPETHARLVELAARDKRALMAELEVIISERYREVENATT